MKDINGVRFTLRERWQMLTHGLGEEIAIHGFWNLVVEGFTMCWYVTVVSHWLRSPVGTFIRKGRSYDLLHESHNEVMRILRRHEGQDNAELWRLRSEVELLRTALDAACYGHQSQMEALLSQAEWKIHDDLLDGVRASRVHNSASEPF